MEKLPMLDTEERTATPPHKPPQARYTGTKTVLATPMTRFAFLLYMGLSLPRDEEEDREGYLVEYTDGEGGNHPNHEGYVSWSPKAPFEGAYRPSASHVDRMRIEYDQLKVRLNDLTAFLATDLFDALDSAEQQDMREQQEAMSAYRQVLERRLDRATPGGSVDTAN